MPMPGDDIAADAAAHGRNRASDADRERVIEVLKAAFVQGRLTRDELGTRVGRAVTSQTYAELTEVTADLPAGLTGARPPRQLPRARPRARPRVSMSTAISAGAFAMLAALMGMVAAVVSRSAIGLIIAAGSIAIVGALAFGTAIVASWQEKSR